MAPGVLSYSSSGTSPSASPVMMTPIDHSDTTSDGFTSLSVGPLDGVGLNIHGQSTNGHSNGHSNGSASAHATSQGYTNPVGGSDAGLKQMPIAIVGMACRMPGSVSSPAEFWELCSRARTGFTPVPKERFNHEAFYHPNPGKTGAYHAEGGNFLDVDLASFDAPFFGLTEKEAISMDPQQRLLLECTFEALENAGIPKHTIVGKDVGVFVGGSFAEYESHLFRDSDTIPMHQATGMRVTPVPQTFNCANIRFRMCPCDAVQQTLTFLRPQGTEFHSRHSLLSKFGRPPLGVPEFACWRVNLSDCWWLPSEHAA